MEKRKHNRIPVEYKYFANSEGTTFSGVCRDVSPYGAGILSNQEVGPANPVDIRIIIPQENISIDAKGEVRYCTRDPGSSAQSSMHLVGIEFAEGSLEDIYVTKSPGQTSRYTPSHTIAINTDAKSCYRLLGDFNRYPEWAGGVDEARILEFYPDGRGKRVEFIHDFFLRKVRYVLEYFYDDDKNVLSWVSAGGDEDILGISGSYSFKHKGSSNCFATYDLDITLSIIPSKRLVQYVTSILMRKEMKNFKNFAEKHANTILN